MSVVLAHGAACTSVSPQRLGDDLDAGVEGHLDVVEIQQAARLAASAGGAAAILGVAQRFYRTSGATCVETATVSPPGGDPTRLNGTPRKPRMA